jgi:hypothetical protein
VSLSTSAPAGASARRRASTLPTTARIGCPRTSGAEYDDTYGVEQKGGDQTVTRTDDADAHGWGMDLQIEVRPPAACGAHRPTR